jgi:outer membrane protein TolC
MKSRLLGQLACLGNLGLMVFLAGCANFSPDGGMGTVQAIAATELGKNVGRIQSDAEAAEVHARVRALLRRPLGVENAVQVALLNNRGLQASFAELASAEAEAVQASLPPSPTISLARLTATRELEIERQVVVNVLGLLTLPRRAEIAELRFKQARLRAAEAMLRLAADTRRSYYRAVAASQLVGFLDQSKTAAEAASELSRKLGETGAINKLNQAREHVFYAELGTQLATARLRRETEREQLTRLMGLWGTDAQYRLPAALPDLPGRPKTMRQIEAEAIERRIDLTIARMELDTLAKSLGLTRATRFVTDLEVAGMRDYERKTEINDLGEAETERTKWKGIEVEFQIPIFDFGESRERQAEALYMRAVHRLAKLAVDIRSEARSAYRTYRAAYDISLQYRNEVLPLRKTISDETLLQYNAMLADPSELLVDARGRVTSNNAAIEANRDFWLATVNLRTAIIGGGSGGGGEAEAATAAAPQAEAGGH